MNAASESPAGQIISTDDFDGPKSISPKGLHSCAHEHADILGVKVSAINLDTAVKFSEDWIEAKKPGYVCVTGVHGVMEAQRSPAFLQILNSAAINTPDGMPMTWIGRLRGFRQMDRVFGPDFMTAMCSRSVERGYRNFFYGGQPGVADLLCSALQRRFPELQVAGAYSPPFRRLRPEEERDLIDVIAKSKPHILWVGLSTPKQEQFMAEFVDRLQVPLLVGVGAAFDFHTGRIRDASDWVKRSGLQWVHRLIQEPKRLWKRYLVNNTVFVWLMVWDLLAARLHQSNYEAASRKSSENPPRPFLGGGS